MKRSQLVPQGSVARTLAAAEESWKKGRFQQSFELLERAIRLAPGNVPVLLELGFRHGLRANYSAAEQCFEKAVSLSQDKTRILAHAGTRCRLFPKQDLAERYLKRALENKDAPPSVCIQLAEVYELLRRQDQAATLVNRALQMDGACADALLARGRLLQQAGQFESAEKSIRTLLNLPDPGLKESHERNLRIRAWYELGLILDRQMRYDDAMAAFLQAKSMLRLYAAPQQAQLHSSRNVFKQLRQTVTAGVLQDWVNFGARLGAPRRLALLGGHPRSGTTVLEQVLDSHPDIISAEETTIFNGEAFQQLAGAPPPNDDAMAQALQHVRDTYFHSMELFLDQPIGNRLLIDKNPSYTIAIPHLVRVFPEIKFLIALRDPRDVCLSIFMQSFPMKATTSAYLSLDTTVDEYIEVMSMWTSMAPILKNPWIEVRYEDLVEDLETVSRRVLDFLGVPWDPKVLRFDEHARQKVVRSPTYADVAKPLFKSAVGRWRNYQKYLEPHLPKLEPFVKRFGY